VKHREDGEALIAEAPVRKLQAQDERHELPRDPGWHRSLGRGDGGEHLTRESEAHANREAARVKVLVHPLQHLSDGVVEGHHFPATAQCLYLREGALWPPARGICQVRPVGQAAKGLGDFGRIRDAQHAQRLNG